MINLHRHTLRILSKYQWPTIIDEMLIRFKSSSNHPTAAIIVIGDEILKAQVKETNSLYARKLLYKYGIKVEKISIIRDNIEDISQELREFCKRFDYIFTCGGIGPTHDDVTYEAAALAFDDTLHYHPILMDIIRDRFKCTAFPSPSYKMAYIPTKAVLKFGINEATGQRLAYPCITMNNIYIFPGSPMYFEMAFLALCKEYFAGNNPFANTEIFLNAREESFATILSETAQKWPNVSFGSYPECNRYYKARITIESENKNDMEAARTMFCERVPANVLIQYDRTPHINCLEKYEMLLARSSERSLYECTFKKFVSYYQRPEEVCIFLDGSEESILMIHLARIVLNKLWQHSTWKLHGFYFNSDLVKSNVMKFFRELCDRYDVELCSLENKKQDNIKLIQELIESKPELRVLLLGKRSNGNKREIYDSLAKINDSCSNVSMRVHFPLIDWSDENISNFYSALSLPYFMQET